MMAAQRLDDTPTAPRPEDFSQILLSGKKPIEKGWTRYCIEKNTLTRGQVGGRNVGYTCGPASGLLVLDIDTPALFKATRENRGWEVPETYTVETGSGGYHLYFQYPQDGGKYGNRVFKETEGFDIRGLDGQVVAPGSIHPDTGKPYRVLKDIPMAPAPSWLLDLSRKSRPPQSTGKRPPASGYGDAALAGELASLASTPEGGRNDQLNRSAFALGQLVADGKLEQARVEAALTEAAVGIGLPPAEVGATIASGMAGGMASPRTAAEKPRGVEAARPIEAEPGGLEFITLGELLASDDEECLWTVDGLLPEGGLSILVGKPKCGKSTLARNLALCVARGRPFLTAGPLPGA